MGTVSNRDQWVHLLNKYWLELYTIIGIYTKHSNLANTLRNKGDYEGLSDILCEAIINAPREKLNNDEDLSSVNENEWTALCELCGTCDLVSNKK